MSTTPQTALARVGADLVDRTSGEVIFDAASYLATLSSPDGLRHQHALAAAYDAAVLSLVGPNDVHEEGGRSFKKKSAWRKLARHFRISSEIVKVDTSTIDGGHFLAVVTARAVAPWGQSYEEVGACCTDEATGRRVITVADAIATASTRASNRAVSNLIAMGEVSAEEMNGRPASTDAPRRSTPRASEGGAPTMPFGRTKGKRLDELDPADVESAIEWAESKGKFSEWVAEARAYLAVARGAPLRASATAKVSEEPSGYAMPQDDNVGMPPGGDFAPVDEDDRLPF